VPGLLSARVQVSALDDVATVVGGQGPDSFMIASDSAGVTPSDNAERSEDSGGKESGPHAVSVMMVASAVIRANPCFINGIWHAPPSGHR
jgi:hypothetical protein